MLATTRPAPVGAGAGRPLSHRRESPRRWSFSRCPHQDLNLSGTGYEPAALAATLYGHLVLSSQSHRAASRVALRRPPLPACHSVRGRVTGTAPLRQSPLGRVIPPARRRIFQRILLPGPRRVALASGHCTIAPALYLFRRTWRAVGALPLGGTKASGGVGSAYRAEPGGGSTPSGRHTWQVTKGDDKAQWMAGVRSAFRPLPERK